MTTRMQATRVLERAVEAHNEQVEAIRALRKEVARIVRLGKAPLERLSELDDKTTNEDTWPRSFADALDEHDAAPFDADTISELLGSDESGGLMTEHHIGKTVALAIKYASTEPRS